MDPVQLLSDLVAANSVNPSLVPGAAGERAAAEVARAAMSAAGLDVVMQEAAPGRPNAIGVLEGRQAGPAMMFCGHIDTVGVEVAGFGDPGPMPTLPSVSCREVSHAAARSACECRHHHTFQAAVPESHNCARYCCSR